MRNIILASVVILTTATGAHAGEACMTEQDLAFLPAIAKHIDLIDTQHAGCVTSSQIIAYKAALKADKAELKARIKARLAAN